MPSMNNKIVTVKITRGELVDLMIACTVIGNAQDTGEKWKRLHDKLHEQLGVYDLKQISKEEKK